MGSIRARKDSGLLFFDFRVGGERCREQTVLPDQAHITQALRALVEE